MNKTVKKVFLLLGILVAIFLGWQLIFSDGGILKTGYNAMANGVNTQYEKIAGDGETLLSNWDAADGSSDDGDGAFGIDIGEG